MKITCLVVDDELPARQLMANYISQIPTLELTGVCTNGIDARKIIEEKKIDILLLDIRMPGISGVELVKGLTEKPLTIFVTAYNEYAAQGYELDVIDYLVKPFPFERFKKAIDKAIEYLNFKLPSRTSNASSDYFFLKTDNRIVKLVFEEVNAIEAQHEYVKVITSEKQIMALMSMNSISALLPNDFIRVHRSFIINLSRVDEVKGNEIMIGKECYPISKNYRESFYARLQDLKF